MPSADEYVLGTHDEEIARLELQHTVWRAHAREAWRRAGFSSGQHVVDIGCGPGFASLDLARLVGPTGRVTAIDRSRPFLAALDRAARAHGLHHIDTLEQDLDDPMLPPDPIDGVWSRWALAFVRHPRELLAAIAARMSASSTIAFHEYFDYALWRGAPPAPELTEFVRTVIDTWRRSGGEPDIGLSLPGWLEELGFEMVHLQPIVDIVSPRDPKWLWLVAFIESGRRRLVDLGELPADRSEAIGAAVQRWANARPPVRMVTPAVLEVIARRR
jgi:SAM-dependent methyltransferase